MADQAKYTSKLQGSRVLVIGGSSGIGYAIAEAVLEFGGEAIISSSSPSRVSAAIASLQTSYPSASTRVFGYACNLLNEQEIESNVLSLLSHSTASGKLDHIIFTAGNPIPPTPITEATLESIHGAGTVRYIAPIFLAKHVPAHLNPGPESSITLTTGVVTEKPIPNYSVIAGPRSAVIGLGKNLAFDLKPTRVNVVAVGAVDTQVWGGIAPEVKEQMFQNLIGRSTTGRIAKPEDVAEAYLYCMRDTNVTGSVISSNGGCLLT